VLKASSILKKVKGGATWRCGIFRYGLDGLPVRMAVPFALRFVTEMDRLDKSSAAHI